MIGHILSKVISGIAMALLLIAPSTAGTGHISIPAAAFVNNSAFISGPGNWYAPLQLPDHALITSMTYYWRDVSPDRDTSVDFVEISFDGPAVSDWVVVSTVYSEGESYIASSSTVTMTLTVDNSTHAYYLAAHLPDDNLEGHVVVIDYTYPVLLLPLIHR